MGFYGFFLRKREVFVARSLRSLWALEPASGVWTAAAGRVEATFRMRVKCRYVGQVCMISHVCIKLGCCAGKV